MPDNSAYPCLCSTCKHAVTCVYVQVAQRPSFYCEEFEIEILPAKVGIQGLVSGSAAPVTPESEGLIGLCLDCENRLACVFPKPEGGIWHCEEYC
ncbi:MAG: hypothetical protein IH624_00060 [Phycisphaerae bacterium]|nr:hypothetical protein [Phycisphaerae bacterium]